MDMGIPPSSYPRGLPHRAVYCTRTLNLRSIQVGSCRVCAAVASVPCCMAVHEPTCPCHTVPVLSISAAVHMPRVLPGSGLVQA